MSVVAYEPRSVTTIENLNFYQSIGRQVQESESCWWYNAYGQRLLYFSFPPHRLIEPVGEELQQVFTKLPAISAVRFMSPATNGNGNSYRWVCRGPYTLDSLSANNRSKVRRGLRHCRIGPLSFAELDEQGQTAQHDTLRRFGKRITSYDASQLKSEAHSYQAWGAWIGTELASFVITQQVDDWIHIQVNRSVNEYLRFYPNNALIFTITSSMLNHPGINAVSYGWESLHPIDSLDRFKLSLGFVQEPVEQRVVLSPLLRGLWNPASRLGLRLLESTIPSNRMVRKVTGFARFISHP
jgi:hypothetical protein